MNTTRLRGGETIKREQELDDTGLGRFFKELLKEFERRYSYTERKRKIYTILKGLPKGVAMARFDMNFKPFEKETITTVFRFDPESDEPLCNHGLFRVDSHADFVEKVSSLFGFRRKFRVNEWILNAVLHSGKYYLVYAREDLLSTEMAFPYLDFVLGHEIMDFIEARCSGYEDEPYAFEVTAERRRDTKGVFVDFAKVEPGVKPQKEMALKEFYGVPKDKACALLDLPYKLNIPDGKYEFKHKNRKGEMRVLTTVGQFQGGRPAILRVVTGTPFSRVMLLYPFRKTDWDQMLFNAIRILNWVIETYRSVSGEYFLPDLRQYDVKEYAMYHPKSGSVMGVHFKFWSPHLKQPLPEEDFMEELQSLMVRGDHVSTERLLLMNARRHYYESDFRYAILEAVIALEISLYLLLRRDLTAKGVDEKAIQRFLRETGTRQCLEVHLPGISKDRTVSNPIQECGGALTLRNKIVHQGLREVSKGDAERKLRNIEELIVHMDSLP